MGKIRLHTIDKTLYLYGRSQMAKAINDNFCRSLNFPGDLSDPLAFRWNEIVPQEDKERLFGSRFISESIKLWINGLFDPYLNLGGYKIDCFSIALNTAIKSKNEQLKVAARLHGQCEIHCYVEGKNRQWFADRIEEESWYNDQPFIPDRGSAFIQGWEEAIALIRSDDSNPVVFSYSVCELFPYSCKPDDYDRDEWDELSEGEQWAIAMPLLREKLLLEISPHNWDSYYFRGGWDAEKLNYLLNLGDADKRFTLAKVFNETMTGVSHAWEAAKNAVSA